MKNPMVYITRDAKQKLDLYIDHCQWEISGLGIVSQHGNNFLIEDIYLFKQKVTAGSTDLSQEDISKFLVECISKGIDTGNLKVWFHSHVNMNTYWSSTDDATIDRIKNDYLISIVGNKKGEYRTRIDIYSPIRLMIDNLKLRVLREEDDELVQIIKDEIKEKVTYEPVVTSGRWVTYSKGGNRRQRNSRPTEKEYERALTVADQYEMSEEELDEYEVEVVDDSVNEDPCEECKDRYTEQCNYTCDVYVRLVVDGGSI